ncbi:MAG TPA: glycosyltransferase family 2 protein [Verrucomicrobiae bacterium]|jgi:dolichol-phosphate mannosyltransferase|nr:glycosyltransferase family 2 protein [Verrucomicrobiae bacterium]
MPLAIDISIPNRFPARNKIPNLTNTRPKLGIATPLANEEATIDDFLTRLLVHLQSQDRVFCVLDNMCKDRTKEIITQWSLRDPRVVLVWAPQNRCVVDAYFAGYRAAFADGCEWILEMDGGLSHLPEEVPLFIDAMTSGYDYVGGSRYRAGGSHRSPWNRILVSKGGTVLTQLLLKTKMSDMTSGFECFNRKAMQMVLEKGVQSRANFFQTEIRFLMHDLRWTEVPITYCNDCYRIGRNSIREALRILWGMRRLAQEKRKSS